MKTNFSLISTKKIELTILAIVAQFVSIYYSFLFYYDINTFFAVLIVLFEITLFVYLPRIKEAKNIAVKWLMIFIVILVVCFSILGVVANGYNFILKSNTNQFKDVPNVKYKVYIDTLKRLQNTKVNLENSRTTLESRTDILKPWENKAKVIEEWTVSNDKLNGDIRVINDKIDKLIVPPETIKVRQELKGYNSIFAITGLKQETCIFILTLTVAILLQLIILTARLYRVRYKKELGTDLEKLGTDLENTGLVEELGTDLEKLGTDELSIVRDKKKLGTDDRIESYIIENFNVDDIIKTGQLKKDLGISEREWKSFDKTTVRNMVKIGTKFKRIN